VATTVAAMPTANPTVSPTRDRRTTGHRRSTTPAQMPASTPNSGPTIIAPTTRIDESSSTAMPARMIATEKNDR
jgi:hypothetical protein